MRGLCFRWDVFAGVLAGLVMTAALSGCIDVHFGGGAEVRPHVPGTPGPLDPKPEPKPKPRPWRR